MTESDIVGLVADYGLWIIAPIALVEGPAISVLSGYLARLGALPLGKIYGCLVLADLLGDLMIYAIGRHLRTRPNSPWLAKTGWGRRQWAQALRAFQAKGGRYLIAAKLTHTAGFAALIAAGMARMPVGKFLAVNLLATLPKVAAFVALGWVFGEISGRVGGWLWGLGLALVAMTIGYLIWRRMRESKGKS